MILEHHLARCARCRRRIERDRELLAQPRSDEESAGVDVLYTGITSPFGTVWLAVGPQGAVAASYGQDEAAFVHGLAAQGISAATYGRNLPSWRDAVDGYFAGERSALDFPVDLTTLRPFAREILTAVRAIPYGETRSYGQVASMGGFPGAARATGAVMASSPVSFFIPCHRVVRADGAAAVYGCETLGACGPAYKQALLEHERGHRRVSAR